MKYLSYEDYKEYNIWDYQSIWNTRFVFKRLWFPNGFIKNRTLRKKIKFTFIYLWQNIRYILKVPEKRLFLCSFDCGIGWKPLVDKVVQKVHNTEGLYIHQVKEKFGRLRIYLNSYQNDLTDLLIDIEKESGTICEYCGTRKNVKCSSGGKYWIKTLCKNCREESK